MKPYLVPGYLLGVAIVVLLALGQAWVVLLVTAYAAVWGGDAVEAFRWWRIRRKCRNSLAYDDLL